MRPQELRIGAMDAGQRRGLTALVVLGALALRAWVHFHSVHGVPESAASFRYLLLSKDWPWVDPPLPDILLAVTRAFPRPDLVLFGLEEVAAMVVLIGLFRLGERWLDFDAALLGAALWGVAAPAVEVFRVPGSEGWEAALAVLTAASMLQIARRRAPEQSWRIGVSAGLLTLFSGGGIVWALGAAAWLPMTSLRFRGWAWVRTTGMILGAWAVVVLPVAVRNAALSGGDPALPGAGDFARLHRATVEATVRAPDMRVFRQNDPPRPASVAYVDSVLQARGLPVRTSEWSRAMNVLTLSLEEAGHHGGKGWIAMGRRILASIAGWSPPGGDPPASLPWASVVALAWVGLAALLPGARQLFPLLLGGVVPLLQGFWLGIDEGTLLAASPFVCLYAGYGLWRIWVARRWIWTWLLAPPLVLAAVFLHRWVASMP